LIIDPPLAILISLGLEQLPAYGSRSEVRCVHVRVVTLRVLADVGEEVGIRVDTAARGTRVSARGGNERDDYRPVSASLGLVDMRRDGSADPGDGDSEAELLIFVYQRRKRASSVEITCPPLSARGYLLGTAELREQPFPAVVLRT
jgi:hypothetical protein